MAGVSQDLLLEYIQKKGGRVKNVDLVKHFRKHLLFDDPRQKEQAREMFKETVNTIAYIKQEEGEKYLYLKDEYRSNSMLKQSPAPSPVRSPSKPPVPTPTRTTPRVTPPYQNGIESEHNSLLSSPQRNSPAARKAIENGSPSRQRSSIPDTSFSNTKQSDSPSSIRRMIPVHPPSSSLVPSSVPVSFGDHFQQQHHGTSHHFLHHGSTGKGHKKISLEISRPMNVQPLNIGTAMNESSDLQKVTSDLENFGKTGMFTHDMYSSSLTSEFISHLPPSSSYVPSSSHVPLSTSHVPSSFNGDVHYQPPPSSVTYSFDNSSNSNTSLHSNLTGSDQNSISPPIVTVTRSASRGSQLGVKALIQQYTVPPGTVLPSEGETSNDSLSPSYKVKRSGSSLSNHITADAAKVQRSSSSAGSSTNSTVQFRRSRVLDPSRNSINLDTLTRQSIRSHQKIAHRLSTLSRNSDDAVISSSKEELLEDQDRDSPVEEYIIEIDPSEKEWLNALVDGNLDTLHHLMMTDNSYVNRRGFINGWTALHWAVKLNRPDMIAAVMISGGKVDIKSNGGLTPLHMAAETDNYDIAKILIEDYTASVNARDNSGRRPIDLVSPWSSNSIRTLLRQGLDTRSIPLSALDIGKNSFNVPHRPRARGLTNLRKQWGSLGHLSDKEIADRANKRKQHHLASPKSIRKGFSFRRKKNYQVNQRSKRDSTVSEYYEHYDD